MEYWFGGAALIGILAGCWAYARIVLWRIVNLAVIRARLEDDVATAVLYYLWKEFHRSPFGEWRFGSFYTFVRPLDRYQIVGFETVGADALLFWKGWRPLLVKFQTQNNLEHGLNPAFVIIGVRGIWNIERLIIRAMDAYNGVQHSGLTSRRFSVERRCGHSGRSARQSIRANGDAPSVSDPSSKGLKPDNRLLRWTREEIGEHDNNEPWEALAFDLEVQGAIEIARRWLRSEKWYRQKRIHWRLGFLLHGKPGTGKTSWVRALAQDLDLPVVSFDLAGFANEEFIDRWRNLMTRAPCVALLEDIDTVFKGRENRLGEEGGGLTFDCLLNCISGIEKADGVLIVVTTNQVNELDEALGRPGLNGLSTRPGRIDYAIELGSLSKKCRTVIAQRILADCPIEIDRLVAEGDGTTGAQFQELCARVALDHYWSSISRNGVFHDMPV